MPSPVGDIRQVESFQAKFSRLLCKKLNISYNNYIDRCRILKLETLEIRRVKFDLILIYKITNKLIDVDFSIFFKLSSSITSYNLRRHKFSIKKPDLAKTSVRNNFFSIRCVNTWNKLPQNIVTSPSLENFKHELNNFNMHSIYSSKIS